MTKYDDLGKPVVLKGATSYKSAGDILNEQQDLIDLQQSSYKRFVDMVIPFYMDQKYKSSYVGGDYKYDIEVEFPHYWIEKHTGTDSIEHFKKNNLSLESSLFATARITASIMKNDAKETNRHKHTVETDVLITKFPELTSNGALILNGVEKVLVSHLEYAPKIRLDRKISGKKEEKRLFFPIATRISYKSKEAQYKTKETQDINTMNYTIAIESDKTTNDGGQIKVKIGDQQQAYSIHTILSHCVKGGGLDPILTKKIVGPFLGLTSTVAQGEVYKYDSNFDLLDSMRAFRLRSTEREMLNKQLSFARRLIGRVLAEDIVDENGTVVIKAGSTFNSIIANQAALYTNNVQVYNRVGSDTVSVFSNNFLDSKILFDSYEIEEIPDIFKGKKLNKTIFEQIMSNEEFITDKERVDNAVVHQDELIGNYLINDDLVSMINLYGEFLADEVDEDNPDSLAVRNIVNIAELYEEALSRRFPGPINSKPMFNITQNDVKLLDSANNYNIVDHIMRAIILPAGLTSDKDNVEKLIWLRLTDIEWRKYIDCKPEQSITKNLPGSLLDLADNTSPMAQANHRRKVSLKKVEKRGGIQSVSSDTRPRIINPSHMGRFDCIESPEGANIGLVRFLTSCAKVNEYGLVTTPFFKVNHRMKKIDYTAAYYLDYDTESRYARCLSPKIANEDKIVIELYRNYNDGATELIYSEDYPVEYIQKPATQESVMLLSEQNSPMDNQQQYTGTYEVKDGLYKGLSNIEKYAEKLKNQHHADSKRLVFHKKDWFIEPDNISAFVGTSGAAKTLSADKIDLVAVSPGQIFSAVSGITPFSQFLDGTRYAMSDAHQKQAIPVMGRQAARIETGTSARLSANASGVVVSQHTGQVKSADSTKVVLITPSGAEEVIPLPTISGSSENTAVISNVCVRPGDIVEKGDILADSNMTSHGHLAHGVELVVAYVPFYGLNFEDSIVISDRLIKDRLLTSAHLVYKEQPLSVINEYPKKLIRPVELIIKQDGTFGGDLIWDFEGGSQPKQQDRPGMDDLHYKTPDSINEGHSGREHRVVDFFFPNIKDEAVLAARNAEAGNCLFSIKNSSDKNNHAENIVREMRNAVKKQFDSNGLIKKGTRVHPNDTIAYYCEVTQKDENQNSLNVKYRSMVYNGEDVGYVKDAYICVKDNVPTIRVIIGHDENIKSADKMSGRHGNKGVISNVLPEVDMPFTEDGRRVDIILTPLGIPSRMNISQLFDCELTEVLKKYGMSLQLNSMERIDVPRLKKLISKDKLPVEGKISFMNMNTGGVVNHLAFSPLKANWTGLRLPAGNWCLYTYDTTVDIYGISVNGQELEFPSTLKTGMNLLHSQGDSNIKWGIQSTKSKPVEILSDRDCFVVNKGSNVDYYRDRSDFNIEEAYDTQREKPFIRLGAGNEASRMIYLHIEDDDTPVSMLGFSTNGDDDKMQLYDGKTGQPFEQKSTVGVAYMVKSRHQVSHKIAARNYRSSAYDINQSPTQGKARDGGQRLGHMEMWSLAEHGANDVLDELLTFKSDDVAAREVYRTAVEVESKIASKALTDRLGDVSQASLQNKAKDYLKLDVTQKNSPHSMKLVDAKLKSVLVNMDYKNPDGESINIYENIVEDGTVKYRDFKNTVKAERKAVLRRLHERIKKYNPDIGSSESNGSSSNKDNAWSMESSLTDKSYGFGFSKTQDDRIDEYSGSPYLPDPETGFSDEYYLFGPVPRDERFRFSTVQTTDEDYVDTTRPILSEDGFYATTGSDDEDPSANENRFLDEIFDGDEFSEQDEFSDLDDEINEINI